MCDFLESRPGEVAGKRVLELGCGAALPGLVADSSAAVLGASDVRSLSPIPIYEKPKIKSRASNKLKPAANRLGAEAG